MALSRATENRQLPNLPRHLPNWGAFEENGKILPKMPNDSEEALNPAIGAKHTCCWVFGPKIRFQDISKSGFQQLKTGKILCNSKEGIKPPKFAEGFWSKIGTGGRPPSPQLHVWVKNGFETLFWVKSLHVLYVIFVSGQQRRTVRAQ